MKDIVERLNDNWRAWGSPHDREQCVNEDLMAMECHEAADEIAALRKALADGAEGAFTAHTEERNKREAAEASRDTWKALRLTTAAERDRFRAVAEAERSNREAAEARAARLEQSLNRAAGFMEVWSKLHEPDHAMMLREANRARQAALADAPKVLARGRYDYGTFLGESADIGVPCIVIATTEETNDEA